jgi:hypothetical protein
VLSAVGPKFPSMACSGLATTIAASTSLVFFVRTHAIDCSTPTVEPPQPSICEALNQAWVLFGVGGFMKEVTVPDSGMKELMMGSWVYA